MAINWKPTAKQKLFIAEYMVDRNATQAAIRAGYAPKYADRQGYQLLGINGVKALIDDQLEKQIKKAELTAAKVNEVLAGMILTNNSDLYTEGPDGTMVPKSADNLTDRQKMSVQEITLMTGADGSGYQRIKQYDKLKAIDIYKDCTDTGIWSGYSTDRVQTARLRGWRRQKLITELDQYLTDIGVPAVDPDDQEFS